MKIKNQAKISIPVLIVLILLGAAMAFPQARPLARNGKIAFASARSGNWEIYSMNSDGTDQTRLTYSTEDGAFLPSWSPNGRQLAFVNITNLLDPYYDLKVMNADGSNQTTLTAAFSSFPIGISLSWSPDGRKIAFNSAGDIFIINIDGSNLVNLTHSMAHDGEPSWSPDGSQIAFTSNRTNSPYGIHIMNADGSNVEQYETGNFSFGAKWSPNGERLLFLNPDYKVSNILFSGNISGSNLITLGGGIDSADWSPDGTKVVLSPGIAIINAAGGGYIEIGPSDGHQPDWQPLLFPDVSVSGRVTTPDGRGLRNATVSITDSDGIRQSTTTSSFGLYRFENVLPGGEYVVSVTSKRFRFAARTLSINENLTGVDFAGLE